MAVVPDAEAGLRAGGRASVIQLRDPNATARRLEREAATLVASAPVPVLVSSRCDVALASGAAGVNLPERDLPVRDARRLLGDALLGRSTHTLAAAQEAEADGADYVIFGPVWPSPSHSGAPAVGLAALAEVARALRIPVLAIGGVTQDRVGECLAAGAAGFAAISLFL